MDEVERIDRPEMRLSVVLAFKWGHWVLTLHEGTQRPVERTLTAHEACKVARRLGPEVVERVEAVIAQNAAHLRQQADQGLERARKDAADGAVRVFDAEQEAREAEAEAARVAGRRSGDEL